MSTVKTDRIESTLMPLPQIEGIGDLESFVASLGQTSFNLTQFNDSVQVRVFVEADEATWSWVDADTINITAPAILEGAKVRVYKVLGDLAYQDYTNIADLVSDEALINAIIFG